ncbi:MAG TPA: MFS transporter [Bacteroidia bacterium]|nr:MFS transporter [Bacteroidia bacterium]
MQQLPLRKQIAYAFGMMGWSILINLINVILLYLYLPPANSGLPNLITQVVILGVFNVIAIIMVSGRSIDAIYDPLIAQYSDTNKNPKGRRIPLMKRAIIPSFVFCFLVFYPLKHQESSLNILWLIIMLIGFYVSSTTYIIPYYALLPELAPSQEKKVTLSTWQSVGYVVGIGIASNAFNITDLLQTNLGITYRLTALQYTVLCMSVLAALFMAIPVFSIDEKKYCSSKPSATPLVPALKNTLKNKNFLLFIVADFSYFIAITIISAGLMYFLTVLLGLKETLGNKLMMTMVLVSFIFYPVVNYFSKKIGKKILVIISLILLSFVFLGIFFLGKSSLSPETQIFLLIIFAGIPFASLNILPVAILAEIIEEDSQKTGENKEGIYFAARFFFVKVAQTLGMGLSAMFLIYGKDPGHDFGIRLNGLCGFLLCLLAALIFMRFREKKQ